MNFKIHKTKDGKILAVADEDLVGKHLKHGDIDFFVNPRFYGEEKAAKEWLIPQMRSNEFLSVKIGRAHV